MITLEITKEAKEKIHFVAPMFWKDKVFNKYEHLGLLDEKTLVYVSLDTHKITIENCDPKEYRARLGMAHSNWAKSNESEFFSAFDEAMEHLRLSPQIRENAGEYHEKPVKELID